MRFYLTGQGVDPYERQRRSCSRREEATAAVIRRGWTRCAAPFLDALLRWAQAIAPIREDALADVGLAWPQLRRMLAELGRRLVAGGVIAEPDDVFWLRAAEIEDALVAPQDLADAGRAAQEVWRGQRRADAPQLLPQGRLGSTVPQMMPATSDEQTGDVLTGHRRQRRPGHRDPPGCWPGRRLRAAAAR